MAISLIVVIVDESNLIYYLLYSSVQESKMQCCSNIIADAELSLDTGVCILVSRGLNLRDESNEKKKRLDERCDTPVGTKTPINTNITLLMLEHINQASGVPSPIPSHLCRKSRNKSHRHAVRASDRISLRVVVHLELLRALTSLVQ